MEQSLMEQPLKDSKHLQESLPLKDHSDMFHKFSEKLLKSLTLLVSVQETPETKTQSQQWRDQLSIQWLQTKIHLKYIEIIAQKKQHVELIEILETFHEAFDRMEIDQYTEKDIKDLLTLYEKIRLIFLNHHF